MPQLDGPRLGKFLAALEEDGIDISVPTPTDPTTLLASQSELSAKKAREISLADDLDEILSEPIIVSSDGYVLDGHHRFVAAIMAGKNIATRSVGLSIQDLLDRAQEFSGKAKAFTAAAASSPWAEVAAKLQAIDDRLAEGLTAAAEHALAAALSAAGRKVLARTKAASVKDRLAAQPITRVVAAAGARMSPRSGSTKTTSSAVPSMTSSPSPIGSSSRRRRPPHRYSVKQRRRPQCSPRRPVRLRFSGRR